MFEVVLYVFSGILLGVALSLVMFGVVSEKELIRTKRMAMFKFYSELLNKKMDRSYQFSTEARRVINAAHMANISKWNN